MHVSMMSPKMMQARAPTPAREAQEATGLAATHGLHFWGLQLFRAFANADDPDASDVAGKAADACQGSPRGLRCCNNACSAMLGPATVFCFGMLMIQILWMMQARVPTPAREAQEATASSRPTSQEIASQIEGFDDDFKVCTLH